MHIISKKALVDFWKRPGHAEAQGPLESWYREAKVATWKGHVDIKSKYGSASILRGGRVVFNIKGNSYRLVVKINYGLGVIYIRFIGTHEEYDRIDAEDI